jgi:hypothetical protein
MRAIATAAKGKGVANALRRAREIGARYGIRPDCMERRIRAVLELVEQSGCRATLPITGVVVARHPHAVVEYAAHGIEFPVHGYYHVDHKALPEHRQLSQLARARLAFEARGLPVAGFRAPYLRWNDATLRAVHENGFLYDCSQAMHLAVFPNVATDAYRRGLDFCGALPAEDHPVVPRYEQGILRLPYVLPDDESMVDRLGITSPEAIADLWLAMFRATHRRGELFTLAAHPERIDICEPGIVAVLDAARKVSPPVWIARHEEIARWWRDRRDATVTVNNGGGGRLCITIRGPVGLTILARSLRVPAPEPWADRYDRVRAMHFDLDVEKRPFIGVHPSTPASLPAFLREQGYIVEVSSARSEYAHYIDHDRFERLDELRLLNEVEAGSSPLLRLGRWPHGARSALSITGDIDALTIRDYVYRLVRH